MHFPLTSLGTAATAWLLLPGAAYAACDVRPIDQTANGLCDGCEYNGTMSVKPNEICERSGTAPSGRTGVDFVFLDGRILQKAKYGIARASSGTVAYKPAVDFIGTDDFIAEYVCRENGKLIRYKIHYNVRVQW
jgi:hypothetical protein